MVAVQRASAASNIRQLNPPKLSDAKKAEVAKGLDTDEKALLKAEKRTAFAHGLMAAIPALLLGLWLGWSAYDQTVARTSDTLQDMAAKGALAQSIAKEMDR